MVRTTVERRAKDSWFLYTRLVCQLRNVQLGIKRKSITKYFAIMQLNFCIQTLVLCLCLLFYSSEIFNFSVRFSIFSFGFSLSFGSSSTQLPSGQFSRLSSAAEFTSSS